MGRILSSLEEKKMAQALINLLLISFALLGRSFFLINHHRRSSQLAYEQDCTEGFTYFGREFLHSYDAHEAVCFGCAVNFFYVSSQN